MNVLPRGVLGLLLMLISAVVCPGAIPDLEGTWAMVQVYPQIAILPFAGEVNRTSTVVQWVEIVQEDATLIMHDRYCFAVIDDGTTLVSTVIPQAFMGSLQPSPRTATLSERGGEILFVQDFYTEVRGARLENVDDALPTDPGDARVVDQDADGPPGMTVSVNILGIIEGEIYVVQRVRYALQQGTIGYPDPDPSKHVFIMLRLEGSLTCEWLGIGRSCSSLNRSKKHHRLSRRLPGKLGWLGQTVSEQITCR